MSSATLSNGTAVTYTYDADGLRTTKQVGSTLYEYEYVGGQLVYEKRGDIRFYYRYDYWDSLHQSRESTRQAQPTLFML